MATVIGVRFRNAGKLYYFNPGSLWPAAGDAVIVETEPLPFVPATCTKRSRSSGWDSFSQSFVIRDKPGRLPFQLTL